MLQQLTIMGRGFRHSSRQAAKAPLRVFAGAIWSRAEMGIDPAIVSAISALVGALMGGSASLAAAIYTQRYQNRLQRIARETAKREQVYADFIMDASKLLLNAYVHDGIILGGDEQHLVGLANRMRLFAPPAIINEAEAVIRGIVEISLKPSVDLRKLATAEMAKNGNSDLLLPFSKACRMDLDQVHWVLH
jgi:hypothetical protein